MNTEKIVECEHRKLNKWINYRLPHVYFSVGICIALASVVTMFIRAFWLEGDQLLIKEVAKKGLLIGLLVMSISRDKEEDELTDKLRLTSYALAFIIGVIYALVMPFVEFGVDSVINENSESLKDLGDFQVLIFMLMIQLLFYHNLKRYR